MPILTINCNARLIDILNGDQTGVVRPYLYPTTPKNKLERQIYVSNQLIKDGFTPFIEVKFVSQYSAREKRIEIIGVNGNLIKFFQFTSRASFDQDANELQRLITEVSSISESKSFTLEGEIITLDDSTDIPLLQQTLHDMGLNIKLRYL